MTTQFECNLFLFRDKVGSISQLAVLVAFKRTWIPGISMALASADSQLAVFRT